MSRGWHRASTPLPLGGDPQEEAPDDFLFAIPINRVQMTNI